MAVDHVLHINCEIVLLHRGRWKYVADSYLICVKNSKYCVIIVVDIWRWIISSNHGAKHS